MTIPTLVLSRGALPEAGPFDLSRSAGEEAQPVKAWDPMQAQHPQGDMWLDYPFAAGYQDLGSVEDAPDGEGALVSDSSSAEHLSAQLVRQSIEAGIAELIAQGEKFGFPRGRCEWIVTELLQNATQYGALSAQSANAGLVRFAWNFEGNADSATLTIAVSNPVPKLFNPAQYCNLPMEEFVLTLESGNNGHSAVPVFVGYLTPGHKLYYLWDLPDGGRIVGSVSDCASNPESADVMYPLTLEVSRYDQDGGEVPYSIEQFHQDVATGLETQTVTVAGVFTNRHIED